MGGPAMRRNLSGSLVPSSSLHGSLAKDLTPSRRKLIDQGLHSLLDEIVADLKAETLAQQIKALRALHGLTRSRGSTEAIQGRFRDDGGLALLVGILRATNGGAGGDESAEVNASATEALFFLTRNNADSRAEAVRVGGVAGLAEALGRGAALPRSVCTLRALHSLLGPDPTGEAAGELLAAGGVHALVALLELLVGAAEQPEGGETWVQEVLALLEPAAARSRPVADLLAASLAPVCHALLGSTEPLTLSLGLDILEEVLANGEPEGTARRLAEQGALAALLHAVRLRGFGAEAAHSLACLVSGDPLLRGALAALLQPEDVAALVRTAAAAARADDVEAAAPARLLGELLGGGAAAAEAGELGGQPDSSLAPTVLRTVVAACCTGACLATELVRGPLLAAAGSAAGALVLRNLPERHAAEAAIAAAQLLPHLPAARGALRRPGALPLLVAAFLEEQARGDEVDASAGLEATGGVVALLRALPAAPEPPLLPPPAPPREPPATNGGGYASVTFHVGGREFVALGWALQRASPAIARTLASIDERDAASAAVVIPDVPGLAPERLYRLFAAACDFAQSGALAADAGDLLALWAVAAVLQMEALQRRCEAAAAERLLGQPGQLAHALELAGRYPTAGGRLGSLCCSRLAAALADGRGGQPARAQLRALAGTCREPLQLGFERLLGRLLSQHLPGGSSQQAAATPAGSRPDDAREALAACSIGSFKEWVGQGQPQPGSARARYRPGSLDFPATPASGSSEIEPLPDSPPARR